MNVNTLDKQQEQEIVSQDEFQKDLLDVDQFFEAMMNSTVFAIAIMDKNHRILRINRLHADNFKKPPESFVGKYCFLEAEKRDQVCPHCPGTRAMVSGKSEVVETQGVRDDGSLFDVRICAVPFYDSNNKPAGFIEMVENITERNKEKEALLKSEMRFKQVAETAGDWIWEVDTQGLFTYANPVVEQILGYKPDEIIGKKHFYDFFAPDNKDELREGALDVLKKKEVFKNSINSKIKKDGEIVILETSGTPVIDKNGNLCGYRGIDRDITERIKQEKQLQQIQEELIEASRRAGMSEVAADVLHNVGNVLNSINVTTTLIKDTISKSEVPNLNKVVDMIEGQLGNIDDFFENDPRGKHIPSYLKEVVQLLTHEQEDITCKLKTLIEDIGHIKTIINMQQEYTKVLGSEVTISIDQVIENAIRINQASMKRHKIGIVKECDDLEEVTINKNGVIQILINLIANAKNALLESEVDDKVITIRSSKHNHNLRIEVSDNGIGISQENLNKLFQHGFTTRKDGHGFGLHSSALAAKEMNGSLTAHSDGLGHGATFTLELPIKLANACWIDDKPIDIS